MPLVSFGFNSFLTWNVRSAARPLGTSSDAKSACRLVGASSDVAAVDHELAGEVGLGVDDVGACLDGLRDENLPDHARSRGRLEHRLCDEDVDALLGALRKDVARRARRQREHRRARAGEEARVRARGRRRLDQRVQVRVHRRTALRLVQPVLAAVRQVLEALLVKSVDEPGDAADIEDGVLALHQVLEDGARVRRLANRLRDEDDDLQPARNGDALALPALAVVDAELDASVDGGRDVVRVALDGRRQLEQRLCAPAVEAVARQDEARNQAGDDCCRRGAEAAGVRDSVLANVLQRRHGLARHLKGLAHAAAAQVRLVLRDAVGAVALGHDGKLVGPLHGELRPHVEGHADAVKAGAHVRRRRRHAHRHGGALDGHLLDDLVVDRVRGVFCAVGRANAARLALRHVVGRSRRQKVKIHRARHLGRRRRRARHEETRGVGDERRRADRGHARGKALQHEPLRARVLARDPLEECRGEALHEPVEGDAAGDAAADGDGIEALRRQQGEAHGEARREIRTSLGTRSSSELN
mmetsp:Transcript_28107/g.96780  ORF Transcript_28107/g.96780 Transcript_28107/m.96780 type:complete len:529 (+) Transcript_28107:2-1588(+)